MQSPVSLTLSSIDAFQIIDALTSRAEAWEKTAASLSGTFDNDDFFIPEECHDSSEAEDVAKHFRDIIESIEGQMNLTQPC